MRIHATGLVLLLLMSFPIQGVTAEEADGTLQARETQAEFFPDTETTILQWRNIYTTDGILLDQLRMATYEVHRTDQGRFYSNSITPNTLIAEGIPACYMTDLNEDCSGKLHSIEYEPEPGVQRGISYAIVTVLRDGSRTEDVDIGFSQTPQGHIEIVEESVAPEQFTASYDVANQSTVFSWRPACPGNNFYHTLYEHNVPATKSTWDEMDKTLVTNFIPATSSKYSLDWTNQSVEREVYYTMTCWYPAYCDDIGCYPAQEDTRLRSGNTLAIPIVEDNQAPRYSGVLSAKFVGEESQTILQWSEITQKEISSLRIYHASNPIVSVEQNGIQILADLDPTTVEFIHQLPSDWMLTSHYAIGLVDTEGNVQVDQFDILGKVGPIVERNLPISLSSFEIEQQNTTLHLQWALDSSFIGGDAVLWKSSSSNPDLSPAWEEVTRLNPQTLVHHITLDTMEEAWYALTLEGTWGSSPSTHHDDRILLGENAFLFVPTTQESDQESSDQDSLQEYVELPEFQLALDVGDTLLGSGDWITLEAESNQSYTLNFTNSQPNSTIRWTDAMNLNPFWSAATTTEEGFSITIVDPVNLIHIESTNVNGEIHIVRVGIDWPDPPVTESNETSENAVQDTKSSGEEEPLSLPLLIVVGIIAAYILIVVSIRQNNQFGHNFEEE